MAKGLTGRASPGKRREFVRPKKGGGGGEGGGQTYEGRERERIVVREGVLGEKGRGQRMRCNLGDAEVRLRWFCLFIPLVLVS